MSKVKIIPDLRFPEFEKNGEWCETNLGDIGDFIGGGTPDTTKAEYWNGDIQWYTPTEVKEGKVGKSIRTITELGLKNSSAKLLPKGSLLLTTRATIGDIAIADFECTTNQGFQSLVVKETEINTFWFYWIIRHKNELIKKSSGSTFPEIGKTEITKINALKPNKPEQQKIASCLLSLDEAIATHSQKLNLLKDHKKALMQNLFPQEGEKVPKYRFKEFEKDGEWVEEPLSSKISVIDGDRGLNYPKAEEYSSDGYCLFLSAKNVTKSGFLFNEFQFITKEKDELLRKGKLARFDIVLTTRGSLGQFAFFDENIQFENIRINSGMVILRAKDNGINPNYLYSYFNSNSIQSAIKSQGFGNAVQQLTVAVINNFTLRYPYDPKEQQKIASCLSSLDSLITAQVEKIEQLKLHKKGLMQGLFPKINE